MRHSSWPGEQERSRALGTYGAVVSAAFASGAVLGDLLAEASWRLVFFVNVTIGIALLTATRQCGSALGAAIVSAVLVATHGSAGHRTAVAMLAAAGFALAGLLATRIVPPGPPHPHLQQPQHLFRHQAGGIP
jgi:MFS family permease